MSDSSDNSTMVEERARKLPKRLKEIAMMELVRMVIEHYFPHVLRPYQDIDSVSDFDAIREEVLAVRDWIYESLSCSVANDVQELIMKTVPRQEDYEIGLIYLSLKYAHLLVLHPKCRNLSSKFVLNDDIGDVIDMLPSLICLEHIEWTVQLQGKETDQFTTNLKYCTRLKVFVHQSFCNDEIIRVLSQNCPLLSVLDVEGSESVTDESTQYIGNMKSLRKCNIERTSIGIEGIVRILKNSTQLYQLDMRYNIRDILEHFEDAGDHIQLSLRTVDLYYYRIAPWLLKKYCPFLTHVRGVEWGSAPPCHLTSVKRLTIIGPFSYSALATCLILENINVLTLSTNEMSDEGLVELSNRCQNITELYVNVYKNASYMRSFSEHRPFQKLKILKFKMMSRCRIKQFIETDSSIFKILLSYSTMVTHVDIINLYIDDRSVDTIFKTNKMRYLEYWRMEETECTSKTFYLLFDMFPMLKYIGKLITWEIDSDELREIENFIRQENYSLDADMSYPNFLIRYIYRD